MNKSIWLNLSLEKFPKLRGTYHTDVAVIGGGIAGVTAALRLREMGKSVVLVDKGAEPSVGETAYTTAHITEVLDTRATDLIEQFGSEHAAGIQAASRRGFDLIGELVKRETINCDYERLGGYLYTEEEDDIDMLKEESSALTVLGVRNRWAKSVPLPFTTAGGISVPEQAQFHPLKFVSSLLRLLRNQGGLIFFDSKVTHLDHGEPCTVHLDSSKILAKDVVICTNDPISHPGFMQTKIASYRSYSVAIRASQTPQFSGLFWDCADPYHYLRGCVTPTGMRIIVGGEDHKTGTEENTSDRFGKLTSYAQQRLGVDFVEARWSGQIVETVDGLPYIGRDSQQPHFFVATGFSGNGITWGIFSAELIAHQIAGLENRWSEIFRPNRLNPSVSTSRYMMENVDFPLCFIGDRIRQAQKIDEIPAEAGGITTVHGRRVAIVKAPSGEIRAFSPICPHMGCYVRWNNGEKTWDCPCHGSRFDCDGKVLNGPAMEGLTPVLLDHQIEKTAVGQELRR